jgi:hypothetical protein
MSAGPEVKYAVGDKIEAFIDDELMEGTIVSVYPTFSYRVRTSTGDAAVNGAFITGKVSGPPEFLTPPESPPSKDIEAGSGDVISSDDIEEGSVVGQIVGEGGTIAKSQYYFPASLQNLWQQGPSKFTDPYTRKKIVDVKWYKAHLVPQGTLGGRRRTKKSKRRARKTRRRHK